MNKQEKIQATAVEAQKLCTALQRVLDPYIDVMDENGADAVTSVQLVAFLIGTRAFISRFEGIEKVVLGALVQSGELTEHNYRAACRDASMLGALEVEMLRRFQAVKKESNE